MAIEFIQRPTVKLTRNDFKVFITKPGWMIISYNGSDEKIYHKAERKGVVRWYKVI